MKITRKQLRALLNEAMLKESVDGVLGAIKRCDSKCKSCPDAKTFKSHLSSCGLDITGSKTSNYGDELYTVKHLSSGQQIVCDDNANNGYDSFTVNDFDNCLSNFGEKILFEM
jgi:hypothetical protein